MIVIHIILKCTQYSFALWWRGVEAWKKRVVRPLHSRSCIIRRRFNRPPAYYDKWHRISYGRPRRREVRKKKVKNIFIIAVPQKHRRKSPDTETRSRLKPASSAPRRRPRGFGGTGEMSVETFHPLNPSRTIIILFVDRTKRTWRSVPNTRV